MEPIDPDATKARVLFCFPYQFYNTQSIQKAYNASHERKAVDITYDEGKDIFNLLCDHENVDFHGTAFNGFMNSYIEREEREGRNACENLLDAEPSRIRPLWTISNNRSKFYDLARADVIAAQEGTQELIPTNQLKQTIAYNNHVYKTTDINRSLFDSIAEKHACSLLWTELGLQVISSNLASLQKAIAILKPAVDLLDGVLINIFWADCLVGLRFRFMKLAKPTDHSVYKIRGFMSTHYDLHVVQWDSRTLQNITLRPKAVDEIEYHKGVRNPWHRWVRCTYGVEHNDPRRWMDSDAMSQSLSSNFMPPEQLHNIRSWVSDISNVKDNIPAESEQNEPKGKLVADEKTVHEAGMSDLAEHVKMTDIEERMRLLDDLDLEKPKVRPSPRLKAGSTALSLKNDGQYANATEDRMDFISIMVEKVTKLVTAMQLYRSEESSCLVHIGQLYVSTAGVPREYRPKDKREWNGFMPMFWEKLFGEESELTRSGGAYFGRRLTSSDDDALFMSNTELKPFARTTDSSTVFEPKPWSDRTSYRLCCQNYISGTIAVIKIDNQQNTSIKAQQRDIGYMNIHFPEWWFDAKMISSLVPCLSDSDIEAFAKLLDAIWIGNPEGGSIRKEKLYARIPEDLRIISCQRTRERIHRTTEKLSNDEAVHLHITRVEDLYMAKDNSASRGFCAFSSSIDPETDLQQMPPGDEQRLWYEAHVHSESLNRVVDDLSAAKPYSHSPYHEQKFVPPQENERLQQSLYSNLVPLFNATHGLVTEWNNIGSRDRASAPIGMPGDSKLGPDTDTATGLEEGLSSALASRSNGRS